MVICLEKDSDFFSKNLSAEEKDLYDRQFRLEGWSQDVIKNSRVLIAGVGGLGCEIAKNLAMLGVGHIDLVDLDIIEQEHLFLSAQDSKIERSGIQRCNLWFQPRLCQGRNNGNPIVIGHSRTAAGCRIDQNITFFPDPLDGLFK